MFLKIAVSLLLGSTFLTPAASPQGSDPEAIRVAEDLMGALGGEEAWQQVRYLRFTRVRGGQRVTVLWDKKMGRFRLEAQNREGEPFVALMSLVTETGDVYLKGVRLDGESLAQYRKMALGAWAGTTYWFLMPFKWRDPGVVLSYVGEETIDGQAYDQVHLKFEDVGVTPGDQYWAYVNRETHLMDRFRFRLQGGTEGDYRWTDWERQGGLLLARERVSENETFHFEDILVATDVPDEAFTDPAPPDLR